MSGGYSTIDEIKTANKKIGHSWFSEATSKEHGSKVESEVIGGFYYVESSFHYVGDPDSGRAYRAVAASPDGSISYLAGGDVFTTAADARNYIETFAESR
jgi:hypothetical protein